MKKLVIFGVGEIGKLSYYYFTHDSNYKVVAFTVDKQFIKQERFCDLPLIEFEKVKKLYPPESHNIFIAMGYNNMNKNRENKYIAARKLGYNFASYISSKATFLSNFTIGDNCMILENNTIQPFVKIKNNVILWSGNHIGHGTTIESNCYISSHVVISGNVHIESNVFIGVNASIRDSITVKKESLIGAGSVIMEDTMPKSVYVPERTKLLNKKSDEIIISPTNSGD